ncbi:MAG: aldehyde dehydrogenase family protein [Elusimicrobia bacterium]|nr:aldehyde dehydrogenase family protein [Elusimicrobiota bacterium]
MSTLAPEDIRITYTSQSADMDAAHRFFDAALAKVRSEAGREYPLYIDHKPVKSSEALLDDASPIDSSLILGRFAAATPAHVDQAIRSAAAQKGAWRRTPWTERVALLRKAAQLTRQRKFELAAVMSLEVGKSRLEALGDAEESADLIDYYCEQMVKAEGFVTTMSKITPIETNVDVLRPYGVFVCIAPFNFPLALSAGMSSAALVAGNTVVYKPAQDTPWTGLKLYEIYRDAGIPAGVVNFITGKGSVIGDPLWQHPLTDGIVFTGSKEVGLHMYAQFSKKWVKPCLLELGGKNPAIVMDSADLDMAAEGVMRSAFGLQGQKCSACSRVYVHKAVAEPFFAKLVERAKAIKAGDPTERDVFFGPVINERAAKKFDAVAARAKKEYEVLLGGERLKGPAFDKGWFVAPTIVKAPLSSDFFMEEFFLPLLTVGVVDSLEVALEESNKAEFGLTGGFYSKKQEEIEAFWDGIESGVTYVNKRSGATTGAWPGAQSFTGWKGSGSTGKGGCGPYYVSQFMREQSRTVIKEG